jgi:TolB-like protein/Flp pilus assembly protein TadD
VFLSYASQDAEPARKICDALRAAGIEVWFDQSELRGGDAWDHKIREQIHDCRLFIPVLSANSERRDEGYFRREWNLAVDRTRDMAHKRAFLVPVVIDGTPERGASVPEKFHELQWTRLPGGETTPEFVERIRRLLSPQTSRLADASHVTSASTPTAPVVAGLAVDRWRWGTIFVVAVAVLALGYLALNRWVLSKHAVPGWEQKSVAVLPLKNESGDPSQQYFADGISEDLITALSQFPGLKVIGRTSSFQFRDSKDDSKTIGAKLGVAHLLEGSVRQAGDMVRVSTELIDTADGSTKWSDRYDRPYKDLFALQDDITHSVAGALKTRLLPGASATQQNDRPPDGNLEAYKSVLEGKYYLGHETEADVRKAIERFSFATKLDPHYGLAWCWESRAWGYLGWQYLDFIPGREAYTKARTAAETALAVAPDLACSHLVRAQVLYRSDFDWHGAEAELRRALEVAPEDIDAKVVLGYVLASLGQVEKAIELTQQGLATDPLDANYYLLLAMYFDGLNRLEEAKRAIQKAIELQPTAQFYYATLASIEVHRGDAPAALAAAQREPPGFFQDAAVAKALQIGSSRAAADAALKNLIDKDADSDLYEVAEVYAIRNDADKTFEWLNRSWVQRDPGIASLHYDPFILRLRNDPRFAAFCRKVGLPTPAEVEARK